MLNERLLEKVGFKLDEKFEYNGKHYVIGTIIGGRYYKVYCYEDRKTLVARGSLQFCINKMKNN